jgi:hypothetical protein
VVAEERTEYSSAPWDVPRHRAITVVDINDRPHRSVDDVLAAEAEFVLLSHLQLNERTGALTKFIWCCVRL